MKCCVVEIANGKKDRKCLRKTVLERACVREFVATSELMPMTVIQSHSVSCVAC